MSDPTAPPDDTDLDAEMAALRSSIGTERPSLSSPPPDLWDEISRRLDEGRWTDPDERSNHLDETTGEFPAGERRYARRGRRPTGLLAGAAAAAIVIALAVGALLDAEGPGRTELTRLDTGSAAGRVELLGTGPATRLQIVVDTDIPADGGDFYEVWIVDRDFSEIVPLGIVDGSGTYRFDLPSSFTPERFPIVDVSLEPSDGDPSHSGQSVLRAELVS